MVEKEQRVEIYSAQAGVSRDQIAAVLHDGWFIVNMTAAGSQLLIVYERDVVGKLPSDTVVGKLPTADQREEFEAIKLKK